MDIAIRAGKLSILVLHIIDTSSIHFQQLKNRFMFRTLSKPLMEQHLWSKFCADVEGRFLRIIHLLNRVKSYMTVCNMSIICNHAIAFVISSHHPRTLPPTPVTLSKNAMTRIACSWRFICGWDVHKIYYYTKHLLCSGERGGGVWRKLREEWDCF